MSAESINHVTLLGWLDRDPELRHVNGSTAVLDLRIETRSRTRPKDGAPPTTRSEWHTATAWGKRAEELVTLLHKGGRVAVEGRLQTRSYEDRQGIKRWSTEIAIESCVPIDVAAPNRAHEDARGAAGHEQEASSDDIPF